MKIRVLFFSRGRGHGHAIPDIEIVRRIGELDSRFEFVFASYSTGHQTFTQAGIPAIDMRLPESNPYLPTLAVAHNLIEQVKPAAVISHEEFAALVASRLLGRPTVFLSAWLPMGSGMAVESMAYADGAVILENDGIFPIPPFMPSRPLFVGPIRRRFAYQRADKLSARSELALPTEATVITVLPGGSSTEERVPISDAVVSAFQAIPGTKRLVWLAGKDHDFLKAKFQSDPNIVVLRFHPTIEQVIVASDVVVTKGTRGATLDCASLGVPTISLSNGSNPIDDYLVSKMTSNVALNSAAVDGPCLLKYLMHACQHPESYFDRRYLPDGDGARPAAEALISELLRLTT